MKKLHDNLSTKNSRTTDPTRSAGTSNNQNRVDDSFETLKINNTLNNKEIADNKKIIVDTQNKLYKLEIPI